MNFGGPGGTGLNTPLFFGQILPADVLSTYDVIGYDARGVGASRPALNCKYVPYNVDPPNPDYRPSTGLLEAPGPDEEDWRAKARTFSAACGAEHADLLPHMNSRDVVRDIDRIRAALGAPKLNFYGFSHGTYLAQLYSTTYPENTRRFVLDGNVDPRTEGYPTLSSRARSFEVVSRPRTTARRTTCGRTRSSTSARRSGTTSWRSARSARTCGRSWHPCSPPRRGGTRACSSRCPPGPRT